MEDAAARVGVDWLELGASAKAERYYKVVEMLVRAGAQVTSDLLEYGKVRADPKMLAALGGKD